MMIYKRRLGTFMILAAVSAQLSGCNPALLLPLVPAPFSFSPELSAFALEPGVAKQNVGVITVGQADFTISRGTLEIDLEKLAVAPAPQKGLADAQTALTLTVTGWIDASSAVDTVCQAGDQYGPYLITFDESLNPIAVSPQDVTLTDKTTQLLNGGEVSFCLEAVSSFAGTVTVGGIILNLGGLPNFPGS